MRMKEDAEAKKGRKAKMKFEKKENENQKTEERKAERREHEPIKRRNSRTVPEEC